MMPNRRSIILIILLSIYGYTLFGGLYVEGNAYVFLVEEGSEVNKESILRSVLNGDLEDFVKISKYNMLLSSSLGYFVEANDILSGSSSDCAVGIPRKGSILYCRAEPIIREFSSYWGAYNAESIKNSGAFRHFSCRISSAESKINATLISTRMGTIEFDNKKFFYDEYSYLGSTSVEVFSKSSRSNGSSVLSITYLKDMDSLSDDLLDLYMIHALREDPNLSSKELLALSGKYKVSDEYISALKEGSLLLRKNGKPHLVTIDHYSKVVGLDVTNFSILLERSLKLNRLEIE